jgi:hypothetical protein
MFTIFDGAQVDFAKNLFCSSQMVGLPTSYHVFVALDKQAYDEMKPMNPSVLLLDFAGRGFRYPEYCRAKMFVHMTLLLWDIEATVCDDDIVFLKDPRELFSETAHFQISPFSGETEFNETFPFHKFNIGFMRVLPTELSILVYQKWLRGAMKATKTWSQAVFYSMMAKAREPGNFGAFQRYSMDSVLGIKEAFLMKWFDPILVSNAATVQRESAARIARRRRINEPYVMHAAWIPGPKKLEFMKQSGLWFLNEQGVCGEIPDRRVFANWTRASVGAKGKPRREKEVKTEAVNG